MTGKEKSLQNLKKFTPEQSREDAVRNGAKGGVRSGEVRRQKKKAADIVQALLDNPIKSGKMEEHLNKIGVKTDKDMTIETAMLAGLVSKACDGNVFAIEKVLEITEKAEDKVEEYLPVKIPAELMGKAYVDLNRHISNGTTREAIIKGGRGSLKSSYPGLKIPELLMANPSMHVLCMRNVKDTLKDSVYEQLKWGIEKLGVSDRFKCTTSPLKIVYKPTGQTIYFRGADDPLKIKSIKPPFGYIGIVWFEEFDQYAGEAAIRNIRQSAIRGTDENGESRSIIFETFNPPPTAHAWANQYVADIQARESDATKRKVGTEVVHTNYTDAPKEWLGDDFICEAEDLKRVNPRAYKNEYLGEVTGTGGNVFENLEIREITDEEVDSFDHIKQGIDWGYFPDYFAFTRTHYDAARMVLYVFDEVARLKTGNEELIELLASYKKEQTIADSAEPKSISDFVRNGYNMRGCVKGAGSVEYGIKWLASRVKIVIDRKRCPHTAKEFEGYEYMKNKDGEFIGGYPDENNHFIDSVRYSRNDEIIRSKAAVKNVRI